MGCHACDSELCEGSHNLPHMKRVLYLPRYPGIADTEGLEPTTFGLRDRCLFQLNYNSLVLPMGLEPTLAELQSVAFPTWLLRLTTTL